MLHEEHAGPGHAVHVEAEAVQLQPRLGQLLVRAAAGAEVVEVLGGEVHVYVDVPGDEVAELDRAERRARLQLVVQSEAGGDGLQRGEDVAESEDAAPRQQEGRGLAPALARQPDLGRGG